MGRESGGDEQELHTAGTGGIESLEEPVRTATTGVGKISGGEGTRSSNEDELLSCLSQQVAQAPKPRFAAAPAEGTEWRADLTVTELYSAHYPALVQLAAMLVRDTPTAEEVVQDAFIAMHMHHVWDRLRDTEKALAYIRRTVVNRSRMVLRHRVVMKKNAPKPEPDMPSAEHGALARLKRTAVVAALRDLPERQREAIVLRYYADLSEAEIAAAMRISRGCVKSQTSRGMATLRAALAQYAL